MKKLIKIFVQEMFNNKEIPPRSNKRFHPRNSTIMNHIIRFRRKLCKSLIDQECLQEKIKEWEEKDPSAKIFFRPKGIVSEFCFAVIYQCFYLNFEIAGINFMFRRSIFLLFLCLLL